MQKHNSYIKEFKLEAIRLLKKGNKPAAELACELGVARNKLYKWKEEFAALGKDAFPGKGRPDIDKDTEIVRVQRELERATEECDILKKATQYFTKESR